MVMCSCITGLKMCLTLQTVEDQHLGHVNIMSALVQCVLLILWYCTIVCVSMRCLCIVTLPLSVCFTKQLNNAVMSVRPGNCKWCAKLCVQRVTVELKIYLCELIKLSNISRHAGCMNK